MKVVCTDGRFWDYQFQADEKLDPELLTVQLWQHCKPHGLRMELLTCQSALS